MQITPAVRSITEYHLALSEQDAREAVDSPYVFADRLADQLRAAGVAPNGSGADAVAEKPKRRKPGHQAHRHQLTLGKASRKAAAKKNGHGRQASAGGLNRVDCPECGQQIAQKYLPLHRLKKHSVTPSSANGAHPEAAPAAA